VEVTGFRWQKLLASPDWRAEATLNVTRGQTGFILAQTENWYKVAIAGKEGWIRKRNIKFRSFPDSLLDYTRAQVDNRSEQSQSYAAGSSNNMVTADSVSENAGNYSDSGSVISDGAARTKKPAAVKQILSFKNVPDLNKSQLFSSIENDRLKKSLLIRNTGIREASLVAIKKAGFPIRKTIDLTSTVVAFTARNSIYEVLQEKPGQVYIKAGKIEGWIEKENTEAFQDSKPTPLFPSILVIGFILLIAIVYYFVFYKISMRASRKKPKRKLILLSKKEKYLSQAFASKSTTLSNYLEDAGFFVQKVRTLNILNRTLVNPLPDIIFIDWQFDKNIADQVEGMLATKTSTTNIILIYFNVPDPSKFRRKTLLENVHPLGISITDTDILKIISPSSQSSVTKPVIKKSIQKSALQGDIHEEGISSFLQVVEIGNKTGCLLIENGHPFGMIYCKEGQIIYAATKQNIAREAVIDILNMDYGRFRFVADKAPHTTNCKIPIMGILMEWTQSRDEAVRN